MHVVEPGVVALPGEMSWRPVGDTTLHCVVDLSLFFPAESRGRGRGVGHMPEPPGEGMPIPCGCNSALVLGDVRCPLLQISWSEPSSDEAEVFPMRWSCSP
jgi:hypothetical protein